MDALADVGLPSEVSEIDVVIDVHTSTRSGKPCLVVVRQRLRLMDGKLTRSGAKREESFLLPSTIRVE